MARESEELIHQTVEALKPLYMAYTQASWEAATTGSEDANRKEQETQAALMRFWADPGRYALARRLHESGAAGDALTARQVKVIYLAAAKAQQDEATIEKLTRLEAEVRAKYYNFRAKVDGKKLSDNQLDEILGKSKDSDQVRQAWEASKQIGAEVAETVRELARVRNAAAKAQGFRDHFQKSLILDEIDEDELLALFEKLDQATRKPFETLKAQIDRERAQRFGIRQQDLRPWHYGDRFFQEVPEMGEISMDDLFADKDPVALATATYDGLGMEVRDILERSDLYARPGKNQHAFCIDIDHEGDVRTLNNLVPNRRWNETLLHELGHAVYDKYIDRSLPWILREPPHTLSTEAIAVMMGALIYDVEWLTGILGVPPAEAERLSQTAQARDRAHRLIFTRWCLVMTHFERALYADPERDLDNLWWDLVEKYQRLRRPEGRQAPDWAAKYHVALAPVYYHNYELGYLSSAQLHDRLRREVGGIVGRNQAGRWLRERVFWPGASQDWMAHIATATGEPLNPDYFVRAVS
ncbi:MAG: M2 family metallopeptidase [Chloroflexota bacterium]